MRAVKPHLVILSALVALCAFLYATDASAKKKPHPARATQVAHLRNGIDWQRSQTWHWQDIALVRRSRTGYAEQTSRSVPYLRWLSTFWSGKRVKARWHASQVPHYSEWLCIHRYEGAWNDPNAPYYGGLQMDMSFQRAHGWDALQRWGTADNWHPLTQMWVAERAWRTRGFYPWPNTARYCGLL